MPDQDVRAPAVLDGDSAITLALGPFDDHTDQGLRSTPPHFHIDERQSE
jgi:hypothetical protein